MLHPHFGLHDNYYCNLSRDLRYVTIISPPPLPAPAKKLSVA